jgi:hypothetical protein
MPRDGCRECLYRRIKCDKTDPSCQKCLKKGIGCSGVGKFCFVSGATRRRRKIASPSTASKIGPSPTLGSLAFDSREDTGDSLLKESNDSGSPSIQQGPLSSNPQQSEQQLSLPLHKSSLSTGPSSQIYRLCDIRADLTLEGLKPGISELLMTCKYSDLSCSLLHVQHPDTISLQSYSTNHGSV